MSFPFIQAINIYESPGLSGYSLNIRRLPLEYYLAYGAGLFILAPNDQVYLVKLKFSTYYEYVGLLPSEKYCLYTLGTSRHRNITKSDFDSLSRPRFFHSRRDKVTHKNRVVGARTIDPNNKPLWLEEWDLLEMFP